jgi:hypothetical protein
MAVLTRKAILEARDLPLETVEVPEWGGEVMVRALTGEEKDNVEANAIEFVGTEQTLKLEGMRVKVVMLGAVDEEGERLFTEQDVIALGKKNSVALDRVFAVIQRMSGLDAKAVERARKN